MHDIQAMRRAIEALEATHPEDALDALLAMGSMPMDPQTRQWTREKRLVLARKVLECVRFEGAIGGKRSGTLSFNPSLGVITLTLGDDFKAVFQVLRPRHILPAGELIFGVAIRQGLHVEISAKGLFGRTSRVLAPETTDTTVN